MIARGVVEHAEWLCFFGREKLPKFFSGFDGCSGGVIWGERCKAGAKKRADGEGRGLNAELIGVASFGNEPMEEGHLTYLWGISVDKRSLVLIANGIDRVGHGPELLFTHICVMADAGRGGSVFADQVDQIVHGL